MTLFFQSLRLVFLDILGDFFYFPVWWYTFGLAKIIKKLSLNLLERGRDFGLDIWLKNLFTPMYGQYDLPGRIISFFMRLAQIIGRSVVLIVWAGILLVFLGLWLLAPIFVVYQIFQTILPLR